MQQAKRAQNSRSPRFHAHPPSFAPKKKTPFLTDPQTSDHTKSSHQFGNIKISLLQAELLALQKQNAELKQTILGLKTNLFFQLNQEKIKDLLRENQRLKNIQHQFKKKLQQVLLQKDFLVRFNKNLKNECQSLTKQIFKLKIQANNQNQQNYLTSQNKKSTKVSINNSSSEDMLKNKNYRRSASAEFILKAGRKYQKQKYEHDYDFSEVEKQKEKEKYKQKRVKVHQNCNTRDKNTNMRQQALNSDYFHGSFNRNMNINMNSNVNGNGVQHPTSIRSKYNSSRQSLIQ